MMHEVYAEEFLRVAAVQTAASRCLTSLKRMCLHEAARHFETLDMKAVLELPTSLLKDLLPHLNISHLDKLQPALNLKGISTYSAWVAILQDIKGPHHVVDIHTEEECKQEAMDTYFQLVFYGFKYRCTARHISNVDIRSLLLVMAKSVKVFYLRPSLFLQSFTAEQRPLLDILEKSVSCVVVTPHICVKREADYMSYILHRMLDHGEAQKLIIHNQSPTVLAGILLHARGSWCANPRLKSRHNEKASCTSTTGTATAGEATASPVTEAPGDECDSVPLFKRSKLDIASGEEESRTPQSPMDSEHLCQRVTPSAAGPLAETCPQGRIHSLEIQGASILPVLIPFLPTWLCLRSLTLQSYSIFSRLSVLTLVKTLKRLSEASGSSLTDLSIGVLPDASLMELLLDASLNLRSLSVEIHPVADSLGLREIKPTGFSELPLEMLSVKVPQVQTNLCSITSVLKRCPNLTSLHVSGLRLPAGSSLRQLLTTVSASNQHLRKLDLEDVNLADCLPEILSLLRNCTIEELSFRDCRLLEKCGNKLEYLQHLVASLKTVSSLHSLSLAQNRLAKSVPVLAQLFTGSSPSAVKKLDISSNFIQPAELLEFGQQMEKHRPPHRVTLDLRKNPWDRDQKAWRAALRCLRPICDYLVDGWKSRDTMADHISNM